jgi:hypothetical protein
MHRMLFVQHYLFQYIHEFPNCTLLLFLCSSASFEVGCKK